MAREEGPEAALHLFARRDFVERARDEFAYDALDEVVFGDVLDDLHQLERRLSKLDGLRRRLVERAVNRVRPSDERAERRIFEAELFGRDARDELGTRLARGVPEFFPRRVGAEVRLVFRREEGGLVVVEPPGQSLGGAVLEVNDGVLVAVEHRVVEERAGRVQQRRVCNVGVPANAREVEAREDCGGGHAVEAVAVVEQAKSHPVNVVRKIFLNESGT